MQARHTSQLPINVPEGMLLTPSQLARALGVHTATIIRWLTKGVRGRKLAGLLVGGRWRITAGAARDFLNPPMATGGECANDAGVPGNSTMADEAAIEQQLDRLGIRGHKKEGCQ